MHRFKYFSLCVFLLLLLNAHASVGELDPNHGIKIFGFDDQAEATAITTLADGKVMLAGATASGKLALLRCNPDGTIDNTFGSGGAIVENIAVRSVAGIAALSNGKILVGGTIEVLGSPDFFVARFNSDGSRDATFHDSLGVDGIAIVVADGSETASDLKVQQDGKIVQAGTSGGDVTLVRYLSSGDRDFGFSGDGIATVSFGTGTGTAQSVEIQPDGKIVTAGRYQPSILSDSEFLVMRFTSVGVPDGGFGGGDGITTTDFFGQSDLAEEVMLQTDGKIVLVGTVHESGQPQPGLARYDTSGILDNSFSSDGKYNIPNLLATGGVNCGQILADGSMVLGGTGSFSLSPTSVAFVLHFVSPGAAFSFGKSDQAGSGIDITVLPNGSYILAGGRPDNQYSNMQSSVFLGSGSFVSTHAYAICCGYDSLVDSLRQPNGKVVSLSFAGNDIALERYDINGNLDLTFQNNGRSITAFPNTTQPVRLAALSLGRYMVAAVEYSLQRQVFLCFNNDGTPYTGFNSTGKLIYDRYPGEELLQDITVQTDGKILVSGYFFDGSDRKGFVYRLNANGTPDDSYGELILGGPPGTQIINVRTALTSGNKLLVVSTTSNFDFEYSDIRVLRLNENGSIDNTFSSGSYSFGVYDTVSAVLKFGFDNFFILGYGYTEPSDPTTYMFLAKFRADGTPDPAFGISGIGKTVLNPGALIATGDLLVQPNGKIVVTGSRNHDLMLMRFRANGEPDANFGSNGTVSVDTGIQVPDFAANVLFLHGYKLRVMGGQFAIGGNAVDVNIATAQFEGAYLFDDFLDGVFNWVQQKPSWSEANSRLIGASSRKAVVLSPASFTGCSICDITATMKTAGGVGNKLSLIGWYENKTNYVELMMKEESDKWILKQRVNGNVVASAKATLPITPDQEYMVRISFDGTHFRVNINGLPLITMAKGTGGNPTGTLSFKVKGTTGTFGSVLIDTP